MWVGSDAAPAGLLRKAALGRRRGSARLATTGCLPGAWLTAAVEAGPRLRQLGCPQGANLTGTRAGLDGPRKARPGAGRRTPRWRAGRRPRSREGTRHTKNNGCATWRAISLAVGGGKGRRASPGPRQRIRAAERWLRLFDN